MKVAPDALKVLLVSRRYYPEVIGGGQISAHHIAVALRGAGVDARVLTFVTGLPRSDEVIDGVPVTRLPIRMLRWFPRLSNLEWMYREMALKTRAFLSEFRPDVLHALNGESVPSIASISKKTSIPFVATINGPWLFCFPGEGTDARGGSCWGCSGLKRLRETIRVRHARGWGARLQAFAFWMYSIPHMALLMWSARKASMLLPISRGVGDELRRLGFSDDRITVLHNPLDELQVGTRNVRRELGIPASAHVIVYAGRVTESKGLREVVRAMKRLPETHFIIVGKGDDELVVRRMAADLGLADRVHGVGYVDNQLLGPYYAAADVVVMAGWFYESLGRMLMEASAAGVPVIGMRRGGIPDVIEHGKTGFLLDSPAELETRLRYVFANPKRAAAMGQAGRIKMKKDFNAGAIAQSLRRVYERVVHA